MLKRGEKDEGESNVGREKEGRINVYKSAAVSEAATSAVKSRQNFISL